ncbi:hypothetical protein [Alloyangia pacifica]|uniref:hypothetical protein n=1 Tax=Alloyangia pacifica TaxID=311180 RepID=UPI0031E3FFE3
MIAGRNYGDNDWQMFKGGHQVGRIYATMLPESERSWMWFVLFGQPAQGYAESMEAALDEVRGRCG